MKRNHGFRRVCALVLSLPLLLTACSGGGGNEAKATTMHLQKTQGAVDVSDGGGTSVEPREGLGLYSGYGVGTERSSYAWVDLDEVKLTKLDENSEIEIKKEGKQLEIEVKSGSLFFNVTEPLADDETLDIRSSTMVVGIRGTCGWVSLSENESSLTLCLLEGKVECTAGEETAAVNAGERAVMTEDGTIAVSALREEDIPAFVWDELSGDLLDEAVENMEEAQEQYPLSGFRAWTGNEYVDESELSPEMKDTILKIYAAASAEDWDEARRLLIAAIDLEDGVVYESENGNGEYSYTSVVHRFYTEYAGYRLWFPRVTETWKSNGNSSGSATLDIRPKSGTGFNIHWQNGFYEHTTVQCENYIWNGSFTYWSKFDDDDYSYEPDLVTGQVADGLLDGEITEWRRGDPYYSANYVKGLPEGSQDTSRGWAMIGRIGTLTTAYPESLLKWGD